MVNRTLKANRTVIPPLRRRLDIVKATVPRGVALSGLEFSGATLPGVYNQDYFGSAQKTVDYFAGKGFNTVRIPFIWERIQPIVNGALDATYLSNLSQLVQEANNVGLKVILDCHNYGRRYISSYGGFTSNFSSPPDQQWLGGTQGSGVLNVNNFQRAIGGSNQNPVSPAPSYSFQTDFTIVSNGGSDTWRAVWLEFYRVDDNNKYFFTADNITSTWQLYKVVNGVQTQLATGTSTFTLGSYYTVSLDVNQTAVGKVTASLGPQGGSLTQIAQVTADPALTHGSVAVFANGVSANIDNVIVNVAGDTTSANTGSGNYTIGSANLPNSAFANLWTLLSTAFRANNGVIAYDIMNEPHDMGTPTSPSNYTTSSWTLAGQAAINAIRANGDNKYIIAELDNWAGGQSLTSSYGSSPTPWWTDPAKKLIYSFHYYFDSDHSGSYSDAYSNTFFTRIDTDLSALFAWAQANKITLHCGEYGVPNTDDRWLDILEKFLTLCDRYGVWTNHWAAGDFYTSPTSLQPGNDTYGNPSVDANQMRVVGKHLGVLVP